jgi:hypothetical protein
LQHVPQRRRDSVLAAALVEKRRPGPDVIGSVGGQKQPPVDRFIAGYQAGAKAANPGITTLNGYSEDFVDLAKCKQVALNQIEQGAGVIFQVAGGCGLGALDAAREKGVWGIGVDADQSFLGPHILTSAVKRVDTAVFLAIKRVVDGKFKGGNMIFGLNQNGVGIGKISVPGVPEGGHPPLGEERLILRPVVGESRLDNQSEPPPRLADPSQLRSGELALRDGPYLDRRDTSRATRVLEHRGGPL